MVIAEVYSIPDLCNKAPVLLNETLPALLFGSFISAFLIAVLKQYRQLIAKDSLAVTDSGSFVST